MAGGEDIAIIPARRRWMLAALILAYTFNFIDRQIVGILAVPIKADLALSDTELGLLGGLAFALFYSGLAIPIAMLADRFSRSWIMTAALASWSVMTALCGFATSFWPLFAARVGVGVGEAGGLAPAYSLVADLYPPAERARALSLYSFGIPIGSALGIVFGGVIATLIDWRFAFVAVGLAGLAFAPIFRLVMRDPPRGGQDAPDASPPPSLRLVLATLAAKPSFWLLALGASCASMIGYGLFFWLPSFFVRSFGIGLLDASLGYGAILLVGGIPGMWLGGWLADRLGQARKAAYALVPAAAFVAMIPFYLFGISANNAAFAFLLLAIPTGLGLVWLGPVVAAIQQLVPPNMRSTASAIFMFVNNLIGIGVGTSALGLLSDGLKARFGDEALRWSILAGTGFYALAALLFLLASRRLARDWHRPAVSSPSGDAPERPAPARDV